MRRTSSRSANQGGTCVQAAVAQAAVVQAAVAQAAIVRVAVAQAAIVQAAVAQAAVIQAAVAQADHAAWRRIVPGASRPGRADDESGGIKQPPGRCRPAPLR